MSNTVEPGLAKSTGIISVAAGVCGFGNCICGFIWLGYNGYGGHGLWSGFGVSLSYNFSYSSILCSVGNVGISKTASTCTNTRSKKSYRLHFMPTRQAIVERCNETNVPLSRRSLRNIL